MRFTFALILTLGITSPLFAQTPQEDSIADAADSHTISSLGFAQRSPAGPKKEKSSRHYIKLNAFALASKSLSLQYEFGFAPKMSISLGLRATPKGSIPFSGAIRDVFFQRAQDEDPSATEDFVQNGTVGGWAITPEFRYYLGSGHQHGFYLAPFFRYSHLNIDWFYTFYDHDLSPPHPLPTTSDLTLNMAGGGLMVGAQWHFGKVILDWWIMGASYNTAHLSGSALSDFSYKTAAQNAKTEQDIEGITVNGKGAEATVDASGTRIDGRANVPLLRFGLCLGYGF